jgi:hypothetical protein
VREQVLSNGRDHALGGRREEKDLREGEDALQDEQPHEEQRDAIDERPAPLLERRVQEEADDQREGQADSGGTEQADGGRYQPECVRSESRQQLRERPW